MTVNCWMCRDEPEDAAWRLHRFEEHRAPTWSLKRDDVLLLLRTARQFVATAERVEALADSYEGVDNEITELWVADIRRALSGDAA